MSPLRGAVIYDCTGNDEQRKIQPPFEFVGFLGLSSGEGWFEILMRQGCSSLEATFGPFTDDPSHQRCCNLRLHWERRKETKIQPPFKFVGPLGLSSREGWIEILMRQGCSRLSVTARNVCPPLQRCE
ncbi:hypothetical protein CDAR_446001 [Caerostris darwini]|uniref:Uncharacterized protein n=1 Tax=Caerostris darwini TaxID=1538125 RepID=A0AAV4U0L1_9ARAC|nr:hypothetical protein CDAR_446001 [Caerostris darwini]